MAGSGITGPEPAGMRPAGGDGAWAGTSGNGAWPTAADGPGRWHASAGGWARRFPPRRRRQALALLLAALAVVVAVRDLAGPEAGTTPVVVAGRDIAAGETIADVDVTVTEVPDEHVPAAAIADPAVVVGKTTAGPLTRGEMFTDARLAGTELAQALTGVDDAHVVAVTPRDSGLAPMLRTGDVVDVLAPGAEPGTARPVAHGARVVLSDDDGVVLLALPAGAAATVASAGLDLPLTLVLSR